MREPDLSGFIRHKYMRNEWLKWAHPFLTKQFFNMSNTNKPMIIVNSDSICASVFIILLAGIQAT